MSRNYIRRITEFHDEHCCAASVNGNFRRSSSLRLRGEKMVQRSPLSTRKLIPVITENTHQKQHSDVPRLLEPGHRPRSHVSTRRYRQFHSLIYLKHCHGYSYQHTRRHVLDSLNTSDVPHSTL